MAEVAALITALQALANMIATMRSPAVPLQISDPLSEDQPFKLATRLGAHNFADVYKGFKKSWDGDVPSFPSVVVKLCLRAAE